MPNQRRTITFFAVAAIATLTVLAPRGASAASCAGMSHENALSGGTVSPGSGTAGSTFTFTVTYSDNADCAPSSIDVRIEGLGPFALSYVGGNIATGATFRVKVDLPAGRLSYFFEATSGSGTGLRSTTLRKVDPAEVVVSAPSVKPTPRPTPRPTPTPGVTPDPSATANAPTPTATAGPGHTARPSHAPSSATPDPAASLAPAAIPLLARPIRNDNDPFGGSGGTVAASTTIVTGRSDLAPSPWLVLVVSSVGAFFGLVLFAVLSVRLADPISGAPLVPLDSRPRR